MWSEQREWVSVTWWCPGWMMTEADHDSPWHPAQGCYDTRQRASYQGCQKCQVLLCRPIKSQECSLFTNQRPGLWLLLSKHWPWVRSEAPGGGQVVMLWHLSLPHQVRMLTHSALSGLLIIMTPRPGRLLMWHTNVIVFSPQAWY